WRIPIVNYRRLSQSDRVDCNRVKPQREDIKCLPTEREEPPPHGMQLKRRSRRQPRSQRNSLRSVRLSRMPRSLSLCELTGTFLITFKKPDRAGKTGSMRRCERLLGIRSARRARNRLVERIV